MMKKKSTEETLLICAAKLLEAGGPLAVTTRAICCEAGVTAPTLYHHFGDKKALLEAVTLRGIKQFLASKRGIHESENALEDLRAGWNRFIDFALSRPQLFQLMIEQVRTAPTLIEEAHQITNERLTRLEREGRLKTTVEFAARSIQVASNGVLGLILQGTRKQEIKRTSRFIFEAIVAQLVTTPPTEKT